MGKKTSVYLGFRGNIVIFKQATIFDEYNTLDQNYRNSLFVNCFHQLQNSKGYPYKGHEYFLYVVMHHQDGLIHCKLARKKLQKLRNLGLQDIEERDIDDFPYINLFVDEKSQKFLIQQNKSIFNDYLVCRDILENILDEVLKNMNSSINIEPLSDNTTFWNYVNDSKSIYELEFSLSMPNALFGAENAAVDFVKSVNEKTQADKIGFKIENKEGVLEINHEYFDTFLDYTESGEGTWKLGYKDLNGNYLTQSSFDSCRRVYIPLTNVQIGNGLYDPNDITRFINEIEVITRLLR